MFIKKNKYFLLIENIKDIDLKNIKIRNKFLIIYRNNKKVDNFNNLLNFRRNWRLKGIKFYIANDSNLAVFLNADGVYLSSYNKNLNILSYKKFNFDTKVELDYGERRTSKDGNKYEEDLKETNRKQDTSEEATNRSSAASRKKGKKGKSKGKKGRK